MKYLLNCFILCALAFSCRTNPCKMTTDAFVIKGSYWGKVHTSDDKNCPVYITIEGVFSKSTLVPYESIYPINLDRKFKKEGLFIRFNYTVSRAKSPDGCQVDAVVNLEQVEKSTSTEGIKFQ